MAKFIFECIFSFIFVFVVLPTFIAGWLVLMGIFLYFAKELGGYFKNETSEAVSNFKTSEKGGCKRYKTLLADISFAYLLGDIGLFLLFILLALAIVSLGILVPMTIAIIKQPFVG